MRISPDQADTIRDVVRATLGPSARVRLFGSRVDDAARGGDIDLFVEVDEPLENRAASASRIAAQCQLRLGDQRIDMEKLGLLASVDDWVEARNLRNRLVHEHLRDSGEFAAALKRARELVPLLNATYNRINRYGRERFAGEGDDWPPLVTDVAEPAD